MSESEVTHRRVANVWDRGVRAWVMVPFVWAGLGSQSGQRSVGVPHHQPTQGT